MAVPCVINELLYYLINNINSFQNESFFSSTAEFFNNDEIIAAKKCLVVDFGAIDTSKVKFSSHGSSKKDKILDIADILSHINSTCGLDKLPTYVSVNLSRIPQYTFLQNYDVLVEKFEKIISTKLSAIEQQVEQLKFHHAEELKEININVQKLNNQVSNIQIKQNTSVSNKVNSSANKLWSDIVQSPIETNAIHNVNNKRTRTLTHDMDLASTSMQIDNNSLNNVNKFIFPNNNNIQKPSIRKINNSSVVNKHSKIPLKNTNEILVIGKNKDTAIKFNNGKPIIKKTFYNLSGCPRCTSNDIVNHFRSQNIELLSCTPSISIHFATPEQLQSKDKSSLTSTSFRICINNNDISKFQNPDLLPDGAILKYWLFKEKIQQNGE